MEGLIFGILRYIVNLNYLENGWCTSWYKTPNKILSILYLPHPTNTLRTELLQTIPHPRARRAGLVLGAASGDGNRSNWTMHKWKLEGFKSLTQYLFLTQRIHFLKDIISHYYSFKIFPLFWLVKTTRIIHHPQLLLTKFGKNFITGKTGDFKIAAKIEPLTEKTRGRGWVV